jgi:hypothetical protein
MSSYLKSFVCAEELSSDDLKAIEAKLIEEEEEEWW